MIILGIKFGLKASGEIFFLCPSTSKGILKSVNLNRLSLFVDIKLWPNFSTTNLGRERIFKMEFNPRG